MILKIASLFLIGAIFILCGVLCLPSFEVKISMILKTILTGLLVTFSTPLFVQCSGNIFQKSELPAEMPEKTVMKFSQNGGMAPTFKEIEISEKRLFIKERTFDDRTPRSSYAVISVDEMSEVYRVFVSNKFDTIQNDERDSIVYDAPSEGIYVRAGKVSKNISYGMNSPLSGSHLERYKAVKSAILKLETKYKDKFKTLENNFAVIKYEPSSHRIYFKNARPLTIDDQEFISIQELIAKSVKEYNSSKNENEKIQNLSEYKFQYLPVTDEKNQKIVYVNAFCNAFEINWRKDIVEVDDGGKCFFNLKINLTNSAVYDFYVNGVG